MKSFSAVCLAAGLVSSVTATGTVSLSVSKRDAAGQASKQARGIYKRAGTASTVEESVYDVLPWSLGGAYYTNISVGTPPQVQTVILDSGSSDLYLDASSAPACKGTSSPHSCRGGSFDTGASSTYSVVIADGFNTSFGDGSTATGDLGKDTVYIGDVVLENVQLGIASEVDTTTGYSVGLMGIGYSYNEAATNKYPNMPEVLKDAGAINSRLYSVFLNDIGDATGTILFGGVDTTKYTGALTTLDLLPQDIEYNDGTQASIVYQFVVAVTGVTSSANGKTTTYLSNGDPTGQDTSDSLPVLLDTGSAAWTVPTRLYSKLAALLGSELDDEGNIACSAQSSDISLSLVFGGAATINVPIRELLAPVYDSATNVQNTTASGEPLCTFMITPDTSGEAAQQGFLTLGDSVLRSMYVVFDLDNAQVSIAQAIANASTAASASDSGAGIKVVAAGPGGVASAVGSANGGVSTAVANTASIAPQVDATAQFDVSTAASAVGTVTGTAAVPFDAQVTAATSGTASGTASAKASASSTSKAAAAGLRVPELDVGVCVVGLVWMAMFGVGVGLVL